MVFTQKQMLLAIGAIVFSPLSSTITMSALHLPISAPEILFLVFLPYLLNNYKFQSIKRKSTIICLYVWLSLICLAILQMEYPLYAILSTARSYLYLIFFFLLFSRPNNFDTKSVFYVCCGVLIGWLLEVIISFKAVILSDVYSVGYGPMLIFPIILGYCAIQKKYFSIASFTIIILSIGILGGARRVLLVLVITLILLLIYFGLKKIKLFAAYLIILLVCGNAIIANQDIIGKSLNEHSPFLYERIFKKTVNFITGDSNEGDEDRKKMIGWIIERIPASLFPKGFVSKQTATDPDTGSYNDVPMLELEYTFGIFGTIFILVYFGIAATKIFLRIKNGLENEIDLIFIGGYIIAIVLLFLEGSFISYPYSVPITGYLFGSIQRISHLKLTINQINKIDITN